MVRPLQLCLLAAAAAVLGLGALSHGATIAPFDVSPKLSPFLGVRIHSLTPQMAEVLEVPAGVVAGAVVTQVYPRSPARLAGLREGDVIVGLDGRAVDGAGELAAAVRGRAGGEPVKIRLVRDGEPVNARARLGWRTVGCDRTCNDSRPTTADTF